ncbi:MAG: Rieske 2Fe-2S domain-containing protein [Chloroflexi bacterium]|nr:Rieske 2Fe-2S domain-containing protein [Chloroflexota bacterium]
MRTVEELELVRVGPGTPSGEVFRRYWLPVEVSANLGGGRGGNSFAGARNPIRVKMLNEHLLLFRGSDGAPHLLEEHCSHRGTSLFYGRVEGDCIRCIYHGWLYDGDGHVVEMPGEPPDSVFKEKVQHPSYPTIEVAGLIFAYMGPPELMPVFPKYHQLFSDDGVRVPGNGGYTEHCNVFQAMHDNNLDPWHGEILHGWFRESPMASAQLRSRRSGVRLLQDPDHLLVGEPASTHAVLLSFSRRTLSIRGPIFGGHVSSLNHYLLRMEDLGLERRLGFRIGEV